MKRKLLITSGVGLANSVLLQQILVTFQRLELLTNEEALDIIEAALQTLETQQHDLSPDHASACVITRRTLERMGSNVRNQAGQRDPPYWKPRKTNKRRKPN